MGNTKNNLEIKSKDKDLESDMKEYENEKFSGIGIKKMKAYKCDLTLDELNQKRERFWKVKMNPKHKNWTIWKVVKQAVDYDEHRASLLLDQYDILTYNGCINHLIDKERNQYKIPNYCINDPYFEREIKENNNCNTEEKKLNIKFYQYGGDTPIIMEVNGSMKGYDIKEKYKKNCDITEDKNIRIFLYGVEIKDEDFLYQHNINEEKPIYIIIK